MQRPGITGTLKNIDGNTLVVVDTKGQSTNATYDTNTRFTREVKADTSAIKQGEQIFVFVKQNQDNTSIATRIVLGNQTDSQGSGGDQGNTPPSNGTPPSGMGTPPAASGTPQSGVVAPPGGNCSQPGQGQGQNQQGQPPTTQGTANQGRPIRGTVTQLDGTTLTISDTNSKSYTVTVDSSANIIQMQSASTSDLQAGAYVSIASKPANQSSTITAQGVTILLSGDTQAGPA